MCLAYDGEFAQNEATFSAKTKEIVIENKIEMQKLPAGGSLQYQPNDKMRSHAIIHSVLPQNMPIFYNILLRILLIFLLLREL